MWTSGVTADEYYLVQLQLVFANTKDVARDRADAQSGVKYAVIGVPLEGGAAHEHVGLADVFDHVPKKAGDEATVALNLASALPAELDSRFFSYAGSLTTPPCSQQATWVVAERSLRVSDDQLRKLREATSPMHAHHEGYVP